MSEMHIKSALYDEYAKDPTNLCHIGQEISIAIPNCSFTAINKSHDGIHMDFTFDPNASFGPSASEDIIKETFSSFLSDLKVPMNDDALDKAIHVTRMPSSFSIII